MGRLTPVQPPGNLNTAFVEDPLSARLVEIAQGTGEGSSVPAQRAHFQALVHRLVADRPDRPVRVLEIGFNAGLSAVAFLTASPQVHLTSLDLAAHGYTEPCAAHLALLFGDRFRFVAGDSTVTVPQLAAGDGSRFDLVLVDGGHDEATCRADILNSRLVAASGALVVVDDLMPHEGWGVWVTHVWEALVEDGVLVEPEVWRALPGALEPQREQGGEAVQECDRRWGVARYGPAA